MKFEPRQVLLKDKETVLIRMCTEEDAAKLIFAKKSYLASSAYIPRLTEEFNPTIEEEQEWICSFATPENSLLLIAVKDDVIVGNIDLTGSNRKVMRHTAVVGMGMLESWRGKGLGTALMEAAIAWAMHNQVLEKLWLQVYSENAAGLALYRKMGFSDNGVITGFFKHGTTYYDNLTMSLELEGKD